MSLSRRGSAPISTEKNMGRLQTAECPSMPPNHPADRSSSVGWLGGMSGKPPTLIQPRASRLLLRYSLRILQLLRLDPELLEVVIALDKVLAELLHHHQPSLYVGLCAGGEP
jgi:hypothetical protein